MILKNLFRKLFPEKRPSILDDKRPFEEIYNDLGVFEYNDDGFTITLGEFSRTIKWNEIEEINAYKKDLLGYDLIVMEIIRDDKAINVDEELPGWFQFLLKTKEIFSSIPKDWEITIAHPAFETNYTNLYKKG